jgi:hypothetical protein
MKTRLLIVSCVVVLLLVGCGEAAQPSPTSTLPPPTPNPYAENAFFAFCKAAVENNFESALQLVTEDFKFIYIMQTDEPSEEEYEGRSGVEELLFDFRKWQMFDCLPVRFEFNGDEVNFWWLERSLYGKYTVYTSCISNGTMQGDKISKIVNNCAIEYWETEEKSE